jgi:hypothetical protein
MSVALACSGCTLGATAAMTLFLSGPRSKPEPTTARHAVDGVNLARSDPYEEIVFRGMGVTKAYQFYMVS